MAFFRDVREDIREAVKKDPAARNGFEVLLCYPGIWALIFHRPALAVPAQLQAAGKNALPAYTLVYGN